MLFLQLCLLIFPQFKNFRRFAMNQKDLLFFKSLLAAPSPSGFEKPASKLWREYVAPFCEEVNFDYHGNSIAVKNMKSPYRLLFAGHIDELGFIVNYINDKGFVYGVNAGLSYIVNNNIDFDLGYKFLKTSKMKELDKINDLSLSLHYFY